MLDLYDTTRFGADNVALGPAGAALLALLAAWASPPTGNVSLQSATSTPQYSVFPDSVQADILGACAAR